MKWPAATPNKGVKKVNADNLLAEYALIIMNQSKNVAPITQAA